MMNVRDFECRSYEQAMELLGGKTRRTICNNTVLIAGIDCNINVLLHGNVIISFYIANPTVLDSCGYRTWTMRDRINRCLPGPWRLAQRNGNWHLRRTTHMEYDCRTVEEVPFMDGMTVPGTGAK